MEEKPLVKIQKVKKDYFGILKGMRRMTKEDELDICPNLEKRFIKKY
ncbi:MAG: hypothetical protein Q8L34_07040 [Candidatus Woesearchaeota archaeon]|nr:hypothetical protein [Candidatus Woesearchaeota archaeon]